MTILDDKLLPGVKKILNKVGETATLTSSPAPTDYNPATGFTTFTGTDYTVLITPPGPYSEAYPNGDIGRAREIVTLLSKQLLNEASVPDPTKGWTLTIGTKISQVLEVEDIKGAWQLTLE